MTFDQFANQGGAAAWDANEAAATKKAADKIFATAATAAAGNPNAGKALNEDVSDDTVASDPGPTDSDADNPVPENPEADSQPIQDSEQPGEIEDPDIAVER